MISRRTSPIVAAVLCCGLVLASSAAGGPSRISTLKIGDHFDVAGSRLDCRVSGTGPAHRVPIVTCGLVRPGTRLPMATSYAFSFGDRGVEVLGPGAERRVVFRARTDPGVPLNDPAPSDRSSNPKRVHLRPVTQGLEGVNVARSSVVCVAVAYPRPHGPALTCSLSSPAIAKALLKPRLAFRPLTVTLSRESLRVWRMSTTKTQTTIFSRRQPAS